LSPPQQRRTPPPHEVPLFLDRTEPLYERPSPEVRWLPLSRPHPLPLPRPVPRALFLPPPRVKLRALPLPPQRLLSRQLPPPRSFLRPLLLPLPRAAPRWLPSPLTLPVSGPAPRLLWHLMLEVLWRLSLVALPCPVLLSPSRSAAHPWRPVLLPIPRRPMSRPVPPPSSLILSLTWLVAAPQLL